MKKKGIKIIIVLFGFFLITSAINFPSKSIQKKDASIPSEINMSYTFKMPLINEKLHYNKEFSSISIQGLLNFGDSGKPSLPVKCLRILLPPKSSVKNIDVNGRLEEIKGNYKVEPVGRHLTFSDKNTYDDVYLDSSIYDSSKMFPGKIYDDLDVGYFRGYSILNMIIYPVQYNPKEGKLYYYKDLEVSIKTKCDGEKHELYRGLAKDEEEIKLRVDNPEMTECYSSVFSDVHKNIRPQVYEYVIVTHIINQGPFQDLVDWKQNFISAKVVNTSYISLHFSGIDHQEEIRNFIRYAYMNYSTDYILLGGDDELIPHRGLYGYLPSTEDFPYVEDFDIPGDIYYAGLDGTWDDDGDGIWGEYADNPDLYAEVYVGRAPVEFNIWSNQTVDFVDKVKRFELSSKPNEILLHQSRFDPSNNPDSRVIGDACDSWISGYRYSIKLYEEDEQVTTTKWSENLSDGRLITLQVGHGNEYAYALDTNNQSGREEIWDIQNTENLTNNFPTVHMSSSCYSGAWDNDSIDCLAEEYILNPDHGAAACIFNARYGLYTLLDAKQYTGEFIEQQFYQLFNQGHQNISKMMQLAKEDFAIIASAQGTTAGMYRWCYYEINLLGDPESPMFIKRYLLPPIAITRPSNVVYIGDNPFLQLPMSFRPIIFGPITVIAESQVQGLKIDSVCFIIDKEKILDNDPPWEFKWKKPSFGRKLIEVEAYKGDKMIGSDKLEVWKFL